MELQVKIIGYLFIFLALIHTGFPSYFKWKNELKPLQLINKQMMLVHTFFIALTVFLMGLLCVTSSYEMINTTLGKRISLGFGIFWFVRLVVQLFGYSSKLWRGKIFETIIHITFTLTWAYFAYIFIYCGFK